MHPSGWISLDNISVRTKLTLGFSLLIGMILVMAYTSWKTTDILRDRNERTSQVASFSSLARDMRTERVVYFIKADDIQAAKWLSALEKTEIQLHTIAPNFRSPMNKALLSEAEETLKRYRSFLNAAVVATQEREVAQRVATASAETANTQLLTLEDVANGESGNNYVRQQLAALSLGIQRMRIGLRGYAEQPSNEAEIIARTAIDSALKEAEALDKSNLPDDAVQGLADTVSEYRNRLDELAGLQARVEAAQGGITTSINSILSITDKLTAIQLELQNSDVADARQRLLVWLSLAVILALLSAWLITRSIVLPLRQTVALLKNVASGDFTHQLNVTRKDELGVLQASMQRMTFNLRGLISEMGDSVVQVASAAEQLSAVTEQTSAGVHSQKIETDQIATAMQEMTASTQEVARNAALAAKSALDASQQAQEGDAVVKKAVVQIERLDSEMDSTKSAMSALRGHAEGIGSVLDVIKAVSDQTNLLALNAAIEAARAGEAGRGFAVVADEVRGLAQRTRSSTEEIAQLITVLNESTDHMAAVLEQNMLLTNSSVGLSREAGEMLRHITSSVKNIESMNDQIACAAEQQSAVGEEINRSVVNVRDISNQTAAASEETAASSMELARISVRLQGITGKFKV